MRPPRTRISRLAQALLVTGVLLLVAPTTAFACIAGGDDPTRDEIARVATRVLDGTVVSSADDRMVIAIDRVVRGRPGAGDETLVAEGHALSRCQLGAFEAGSHVVLAYVEKGVQVAQAGGWTIEADGTFDPDEGSPPDWAPTYDALLVALAGMPTTDTATALSLEPGRPAPHRPLALLAALVVAAAGDVAWRRRRNHILHRAG